MGLLREVVERFHSRKENDRIDASAIRIYMDRSQKNYSASEKYTLVRRVGGESA